MQGDHLSLRLFGWDLGRFLRWWREGLLQCLPPRLRQLGRDVRPRLVLDPGEAELVVRWVEGGEGRELGRCASPSLSAPEESVIRRARGLIPPRLERRSSVLELRIPSDHALRRELTMPLEVESNLRKSVGYQVARLTPFQPEDVYYDAMVTARDKQQRQLRVELFMVPRKLLDPWLRQLNEHWGGPPDTVSVAGVDGELNLLPRTDRPETHESGSRVKLLLGALVLVLLAVAIALPLVQKWRLVHDLEDRLAEARPRAVAIMEQREEVDKAGQALAFLKARRMGQGEPLELIEQLSRVCGDDTWLQFVELQGEALRMRGHTNEAVTLTERLNGLPFLNDVHFLSPVTRIQPSGKERFYIEAKVTAGEARG